MPYQTSANSNAFVLGSCRVFVPSTTAGQYWELGAARGVKLTETWENFVIETDNTPEVRIGAKNQKITVEGNLLELNFIKLNRLRNGFDGGFSTTTFTFTSGGKTTITPQALYLVHKAASSSETITATIFYASVDEGITIPFPKDSGIEAAEIPFKITGTCQSTKTAGEQLYSIVDLRANIYSTSYTYESTSLA